ncbi:MAG: hypothetical protein WCR74_03050 [Betaproteobacteria bacterium]
MKITFPSGRIASLGELVQFRAYAGLLAGLPDSRINQRQIDDLINEGRRIHLDGCEPVLIHPRIKTIEHTNSGQSAQELRLPDICCAARFESGALLRANSEPYSSLVVVWFQDEFAMPIPTEIEHQISQIDWERDAADWCW